MFWSRTTERPLFIGLNEEEEPNVPFSIWEIRVDIDFLLPKLQIHHDIERALRRLDKWNNEIGIYVLHTPASRVVLATLFCIPIDRQLQSFAQTDLRLIAEVCTRFFNGCPRFWNVTGA